MYEKLRTYKSDVPKGFRESFEKALAEAWKDYNDRGARLVDAFEDNTMELAFAKGFLSGCINAEKKVLDKVCEWFKREYEDIGIRYIRGYEAEDYFDDIKQAMEE